MTLATIVTIGILFVVALFGLWFVWGLHQSATTPSYSLPTRGRGIVYRYTAHPYDGPGDDYMARYRELIVPEDDPDEIWYWLGSMGVDDADGAVVTIWLSTLHELSHWADDEVAGDGHSERWNRVLVEQMQYVLDDGTIAFERDPD